LPVEILAWGFWFILAAVVIAALSFFRKMLSPPATAQEIADELIKRGWSTSGAPSLAQLKAAVHEGVNGTAERVKRIETMLDGVEALVHQNSKAADLRHAENMERFGRLEATVGVSWNGRDRRRLGDG
jgi:hypothetical protein